MSKPSSYDLLLEVQKSVNRLEDKLDTRMQKIEVRVDVVETKIDQIMGKIGVAVAIVTLIVSALITFIVDWLKKIFMKT